MFGLVALCLVGVSDRQDIRREERVAEGNRALYDWRGIDEVLWWVAGLSISCGNV